MEENQIRITAWHEAAHAVCGKSLGYTIARVSIEPSIDRIGYCGADPHLSGLASAVWYLSGPCAEAKYRESIGLATDYRGSEKDFDDTHRVLSALVPNLPRATLFDAPIFRTAWDDAMKLVSGLAAEIDQFADVLLEHKILVGSALQAALGGRPVKSITERREELDKIAVNLKRTRRPVSPMRASASPIFNMPLGHGFPQDLMRRHGIKIMSMAERLEILSEHDRIMGPAGARRIAAKPAAKRNLAGVRARAKRQMNELNKRHASDRP